MTAEEKKTMEMMLESLIRMIGHSNQKICELQKRIEMLETEISLDYHKVHRRTAEM